MSSLHALLYSILLGALLSCVVWLTALQRQVNQLEAELAGLDLILAREIQVDQVMVDYLEQHHKTLFHEKNAARLRHPHYQE